MHKLITSILNPLNFIQTSISFIEKKESSYTGYIHHHIRIPFSHPLKIVESLFHPRTRFTVSIRARTILTFYILDFNRLVPNNRVFHHLFPPPFGP